MSISHAAQNDGLLPFGEMLDHVVANSSPRLLRLLAIRCAYLVIPRSDSWGYHLDLAEKYADGLVSSREFPPPRFHHWQWSIPFFLDQLSTVCSSEPIPEELDWWKQYILGLDECFQLDQGVKQLVDSSVEAGVLRLMREIYGNPLKMRPMDPRWRTSTVVDLAQAIYDDFPKIGLRNGVGYERFPILADALMDAGCDSDEMILHCRGPGPHVKGCWVVDLILGKE